jgi:hypothetical protein
MQINIQAFEVDLGHGITMDQFYNYISRSSSDLIESRYLYVSRSAAGWWRGLLLTSRNIRAFTRMQRNEGHITLTPQNLGNSELAHFNYFILHERLKRGLFQRYHGAASLDGFGSNLKRRYHALKERLVLDACIAAGIETGQPNRAIQNRFRGNLSYSVVLRRTSFDDLIRDLRSIKSVTCEFREYIPSERAFQPLASRATAVRHRLTFRDQNRSIVNDLINFARFEGLKGLSGVGVGHDNLEKRFRLYNEPETLGSYDFNEVVMSTHFDSSQITASLEESDMIRRLHRIAEDDPWCRGDI